MHDHCVLIYNSYFNCEKIKCLPSCHCSGNIRHRVSEKGQIRSLRDWLLVTTYDARSKDSITQ